MRSPASDYSRIAGIQSGMVRHRDLQARSAPQPSDARKTRQPVSGFERFLPALLILIVLGVYALAMGAEFIGWDDPTNVPDNPVLKLPGTQAIARFWSGPYDKLYIPVTYSVWTILAAVGTVNTPSGGVEFNPFIFHAANVILHALATVLVYQILRLRIRSAWACAAGALLFAVHPVQVEAVAWVTAMKDVLSGALALAAVWLFMLGVESVKGLADGKHFDPDRDSSHRPIRWEMYIFSLLLFSLSLLAKPSAVAAIPIVLILYWLGSNRHWRRVGALLLPWVVLALADVLVTHAVQPIAAPADGGRWWLRPLIAGDALAFYLYKLFIPIRLGLFYGRTPAAIIENGSIWFTWIVPVLVLGAIAWLGRKSRWPAAAALLFFAGVLPVLGLVPFTFQAYSTVADHYLYLSMFGPALALAMILSIAGIVRTKAVILRWGAGVVLLILAGLTVAQTRYWHDSIALFSHAYAVNPHSGEAAILLAGQYNTLGDATDALLWVDRAAPNVPKSNGSQSILHSTRASALLNAHRYNEAERELETAMQLDPTNQLARYNLDVLREKRARGTLGTGR